MIDADRFHSDVAGEELALRQQKYHREQQIYDNKRLLHAEKEENRWKRIEEAKAAEEAYWVEQRDLGVKVFTSKSVCNFKNISSLTSMRFFVPKQSNVLPSLQLTGEKERIGRSVQHSNAPVQRRC